MQYRTLVPLALYLLHITCWDSAGQVMGVFRLKTKSRTLSASILMYGGTPEKHDEAFRHVLRIIEDVVRTVVHTGLEKEQIQPLSSDGMPPDSDKVALRVLLCISCRKGLHRRLH